MAVLVLAEQTADGKGLNPSTLSCVSAARKMDPAGPVALLVCGSNADKLSKVAASVAGVDDVLVGFLTHSLPLFLSPSFHQSMSIFQ